MISSDIIVLIVLVCLIIIILNLNFVNAKKARKKQSEQKLNEIKEITKVKKEETPPVEDNSNYLHDYFNNLNTFEFEDVNFQEVPSEEVVKTVKAVGEIKKFNSSIPEYIDEIENTANIVFEMDEAVDETDDYEEDFAIGLNDDEEEFKNALSEEFSNLSPAMKAFIMANILKNKNDNPNDNNSI